MQPGTTSDPQPATGDACLQAFVTGQPTNHYVVELSWKSDTGVVRFKCQCGTEVRMAVEESSIYRLMRSAYWHNRPVESYGLRTES